MNDSASVAPCWYAAYTAPRHEKSVALHLQTRGIDNYLALYDSRRMWGHRTAIVQVPLFPGYIFVHIPSHERTRVLEAPGVLHIVGCNGFLTPIPDAEIASIRTVLQTRPSQPHPYLHEGERVRVTRGPLRGLEGVILRHTRQLRMVVSIDCIMKSFEVELAPGDLTAACAHPTTSLVQHCS